MIIRTTAAIAAALLVAASTLSAFQAKPADLSGVWTGTLDRSDGSSSAHLVLKQNGADLTGSCGPDADRQTAIANAKVATVEGVTTATFDATQPSGAVMRFDLRLVDGRLKGKVVLEANGQIRGEAALDVGREKK